MNLSRAVFMSWILLCSDMEPLQSRHTTAGNISPRPMPPPRASRFVIEVTPLSSLSLRGVGLVKYANLALCFVEIAKLHKMLPLARLSVLANYFARITPQRVQAGSATLEL